VAEEQPPHFRIDVPPKLQGGAYANFLTVWHTGHEFTLDFSATQPPEPPSEEGGPVTVPCTVVSRLRIPPTLVFEILQALNTNLAIYEGAFGEVRRPERNE
jgi:Protein of unknown function (DUF3467)